MGQWLQFKSRLDTTSLFFGFLIGFSIYLALSHLLLGSFLDSSSNNNEQPFIKTQYRQTRAWNAMNALVVPWAYSNDMEKLVNSESFPAEAHKPPQANILSAEKATDLKAKRVENSFYGGGAVDEKHLGGWKFNDSDTYERELWDWVIPTLNITSVMDVGCGIGCSTTYFRKHPNVKDALCVEGSIDAVNNSLVPDVTRHHDYTLGAFWPNKVYDMLWSAEFLEHVEEQYMENYMATFKAAKVLLVTHSEWGGWNHVNVKSSEWWIYKFESYGFAYQDTITQKAREKCPLLGVDFKYGPNSWHDLHTDGNRKNSHFHFRGLVFFNKLFMNRMTEFDNKVLELL